MKHTRRNIFHMAVIFSVVAIQMASAARALADDGTPPEETPVVTPTEVPVVTEEPTGEATPAEELTPTEELAPTETDAAPTEEATPEESATPVPDETAAPECVAADDPAAADGTLPVCEEALDDQVTVPISDPIWCPGGASPINDPDGLCTPPQASIADLIAYLRDNGYAGPGSIYIQAGNYVTAETYVVIDYTDVPLLDTLSVLGGWDLDLADGDGYGAPGTGDVTVFTVPVEVIWDTNVTLQDLVVQLGAADPNVGLFVDSGGNITLINVDVTGGFAGADLDAAGNVTVTGSDIAGAGASAAGGTGLTIYSSGSVTLTNVTVDNYSSGIYINNTAADPVAAVNLFTVGVTDSVYTGLDVRSAGDISLDGVTVTGGTVGAYLEASGAGNIFVLGGSSFIGSSSIGIRAITNEGNISLTGVGTDNGGLAGSFGAWLKSYGGGSISVVGGGFENAETGLFIVGTSDVTLTNVVAEDNLGDGVVIESGWVFGCFGPDGIPVTVDGGMYANNGDYGVVIYPGPNGTGTLLGTITFIGNGGGDSLIDLTKTCIPGGEEKPSKPYQVVEISGKGDDPVLPDCENYSGAILILPDLTQVKLACPVTSEVTVESVVEADLPGPLPKTFELISGLVVTAGDDGSPVKMCFKLPAETLGKNFTILYWDPIANGNVGGWVELPKNQFGGQVFQLHPDTPDDGMQILEGVYQSGDCICVKVNFSGTFVLVAR
jgi:hypothetical protein